MRRPALPGVLCQQHQSEAPVRHFQEHSRTAVPPSAQCTPDCRSQGREAVAASSRFRAQQWLSTRAAAHAGGCRWRAAAAACAPHCCCWPCWHGQLLLRLLTAAAARPCHSQAAAVQAATLAAVVPRARPVHHRARRCLRQAAHAPCHRCSSGSRMTAAAPQRATCAQPASAAARPRPPIWSQRAGARS